MRIRISCVPRIILSLGVLLLSLSPALAQPTGRYDVVIDGSGEEWRTWLDAEWYSVRPEQIDAMDMQGYNWEVGRFYADRESNGGRCNQRPDCPTYAHRHGASSHFLAQYITRAARRSSIPNLPAGAELSDEG